MTTEIFLEPPDSIAEELIGDVLLIDRYITVQGSVSTTTNHVVFTLNNTAYPQDLGRNR